MVKSDTDIWLEIRQGSKYALEQLYERYIAQLYNYGCKICVNNIVVEDALQDVFMDLWRYHENLSTPDSVIFYLYASLRRKILTEDRRNTSILRFSFLNEEITPVTQYYEQEYYERDNFESQRLKSSLILNLSSRQYEAITLYFFDEMSYFEIAKLMEINEQSARNLVRRGLVHLRKYIHVIL